MAKGQQSKVFIEAGGSFGKTKSATAAYSVADMNMDQEYSAGTPKINAQLGFGLSAHSFIGLAYDFSRSKSSQEYSLYMNNLVSLNQTELKSKTQSFGIFYRAYVKPFEKLGWNLFADLTPRYQLTKKEYKSSNLTRPLDDLYTPGSGYVSASETKSETEIKALDVDLRVGGAYRFSNHFQVQLSLHNMVNVNHTFGDYKNTNFNVFQSPFNNAFLSAVYTF